MYPTLSVGPLEINLYVTMRVTGVAVLLAGLLLRLRSGRWPVTPRMLLFDGLPWLIVGLVVGSALENALPYLVDGLRGVPLPAQWWQGSRWLGALAGASALGYLYCRQRGVPAGPAFDFFALPLPLALAVARAGCLLAGCCYGRETTAWPSLVLPDAQGVWASRYPTRLAEIAANLLIFACLAAFERYTVRRKGTVHAWPFAGFLYLLFVELHLGQRFLIEFWRADTPALAGPFNWPHLHCALGMGLATWLIVRGLRQRDVALPAYEAPTGQKLGIRETFEQNP